MSEQIDGIETFRIQGETSKLFESLAKAQLEFTPVPRSKPGQSGNRSFKYADYATIMRCVRPALANHGIAIVQPLHSRDGQAVTTTILAGHGAAIVSSLSFPLQKDPQEFGKHHTYYRRYQLQAILGLEGDKDADDLPDVNEEHAQFQEQTVVPAKEPKQPPAPKAAASAEKKSAAAEKANGSAKQSDSSTKADTQPSEEKPNGKAAEASVHAETKPMPEHDVATLKTLITEGMKTLKWKMINLREFYASHVDAREMPKPDDMPIELMRKLHAKMVEVHGVAPF